MTDKMVQVTEQNIDIPTVEVLTGRGFITGKSDSGKSNTGGVILEELLEQSMPCLIVDIEGEYYGLKEEFEVLHIGADEECDLQVGIEHAEKVAEICLDQNIPVVLDVSGYLESKTQEKLIDEVLGQLFTKEKKAKTPFLIVVEEAHEFVPQEGSTDCSSIILKIAKRGRKRGLGIMGLTQRPASLDKDFITQCNWKVWHRLDYSTDLEVVRKVLEKNKPRNECIDREVCANCGIEYEMQSFDDLSDAKCPECGTEPRNWRQVISNLKPGEGVLEADYLDFKARRVKFLRKETFDAGATPDLQEFEEPELKQVSEQLVGELQKISENKKQERNRIEELESVIEEKEDRIEELEKEVEMEKRNTETVDQLAERLMNVAGDEGESSKALKQIKEEKNQRIQELESEVEEERNSREDLEEKLDDYDDLKEYREKAQRLEEREKEIAEAVQRIQEAIGVDSSIDDEKLKSKLDSKNKKIEDLKERVQKLQESSSVIDEEFKEATDFLKNETVRAAVNTASEKSSYGNEHFWDVCTTLAHKGSMDRNTLVPYLEVSDSSCKKILQKLVNESVLKKERDGKKHLYEINTQGLEDIIKKKREKDELRELSDEVMNE